MQKLVFNRRPFRIGSRVIIDSKMVAKATKDYLKLGGMITKLPESKQNYLDLKQLEDEFRPILGRHDMVLAKGFKELMKSRGFWRSKLRGKQPNSIGKVPHRTPFQPFLPHNQ